MKFYFVYILKCADDSYYVGITNDVERRLIEHNSNKKIHSYTFTKRPNLLVWFEQFTTPDEAICREKQLKGWSRKKKEALINENWDNLIELSKNYTDSKKSSTSSD
ncbi:MAG: GIY-YIG nuclease family protein [Lutibacter sp.]|nr:GIY-YIG nuclease family protein [Lutibacter sp.]MBP9600109.1 GIY-YIG nuclease family protein [Lutibacter sp.]